ncbi:MAG TPA: hypothetical protein VNZ86_01255 [Bacteroidia bacterium]|nr:hypothetical protein [Bacteroidia bacterium]
MAKAQQKTEKKKGDKYTPPAASLVATRRLDSWIAKNGKGLLVFLLILTGLFSLLLFSMRISEGGDDATYIKAGFDYSRHFTTFYYTFNAPGYPMFLSLPLAIFGLNITLLKFLSLLFYFFGAYFLYKGLQGKIRGVLLFPVMFIMAVNAYAQYYASQTYNEAFFFFFQGLFVYVFFRLTTLLETASGPFYQPWKKWLALGILLFILAFIKNAAIVAVPAVMLYFLIDRKFLSSLMTLISYLVIKLPFELIKRLIWGNISQFSAQGNILSLKDPYDKTKGYEDMAGYAGRLFDNMDIYLGKRMWEILGVFGKDPPVDDGSKSLYAFLAKIVLLVFLILFIVQLVRRKDMPTLFILIYTGITLLTSFIALQARWDQPRIIIILLPFLVYLILYSLLGIMERSSLGSGFFLVISLLLCISSLLSSFKRIGDNLPNLSKNIRGDIYAGYTPDWVNFLRMSRWCADNLPKDALVASRKAPMSFIYGKGKEFYPVYRVIAYDTVSHQSDPDSVLAIFKKAGVTHVMLASLRIDPAHNSGQIINTLNNILAPVANKYKDRVVLVHTEGETEVAELYEIKYGDR